MVTVAVEHIMICLAFTWKTGHRFSNTYSAPTHTLLHTHTNYSGLLPLINIIMTDDIVIELITIPGSIDESF